MTRWSAGADSGARSGIAIVRRDKADDRPVLIGVWPVFGADHLWLLRARDACSEVNASTDTDVVLSIENPPKTGRTNALKGDSRGHTTWRGMGRRKGMFEGVWFCVTGRCAKSVEQSDWVSVFAGLAKKKKVGDGTHRILEATMLVQGAGAALKEVRKSCRVDCAEAILIAASGLYRRS